MSALQAVPTTALDAPAPSRPSPDNGAVPWPAPSQPYHREGGCGTACVPGASTGSFASAHSERGRQHGSYEPYRGYGALPPWV